MKLELSQPFTLEVKDESKKVETIKGTLSPLTKKEQLEFERAFDKDKAKAKELQKQSKELSRLSKKVEDAETNKDKNLEQLYKEFDALEELVLEGIEELKELDTQDSTAKKRIDMCVKSDSLDRIHELCEIVGYRTVLDTIMQDIEERKGNGIPA